MRVLIPAIAFVRALAFVNSLQAQERVLVGRITDSTGAPLSDVSVDVAGTLWRTTTTSDGTFVIAAPARTALVRARRIGFDPDSVLVEASVSSVRLILHRQPQRLQGIMVLSDASNSSMEISVTPETVRNVPPLGEPDIFRAIALLPAVSEPNDLKGSIHLAGGASDETGVELDGHPLQEPFHMLGVLGSFNLASLDRADLFLHHVPVDREGGLSGLVSLHTRKPSMPEREVVVSLLSAGVTVAQPHVVGGVNVLASGRLTYLDKLLQALGDRARINGDEPTVIGYRDALLTADRAWGKATLEMDYFASRDHRPMGPGTEYAWGERLLGTTLAYNGSDWNLKGRVSFNRAAASLPDRSGQPFAQVVDLRHDLFSSALDARYSSEQWSILFGLAAIGRNNRQYWTNAPDGFFTPHAPSSFAGSEHQQRYSVLTEYVRRIGTTTVTGGTRVTKSPGGVFEEPRLLIDEGLGEQLQLGIALDRRLQFETQFEEPREGTGKQPLFLLVEPRIADVAAISLRRGHPASRDWELGSFYKRYRNRTALVTEPIVPPTAQPPPGRPPRFRRIPGFAYGATASWLHRPTARTLIQASYTYQIVREKFDSVYSPAEWDAPHALSLFGTAQLSRKWSLNLVTQWRSGAVATPIAVAVFAPDRELSTRLLPRYFPGPRNSARLPGYQRLDLGVRRESIHGRREFAFTAQVINVLGRANALEYDAESLHCAQSGCGNTKPSRRGLPLIPSVGFEMRW